MDRVFLDANVLFSVAYLPEPGLLRLWHLPGVRLITSAYALEEARFNLPDAEQRKRLSKLSEALEIGTGSTAGRLPGDVALPPEDGMLLSTAIGMGAQFFLSGDKRHFGPYFGKRIHGVRILTPSEFLRVRSR